MSSTPLARIIRASRDRKMITAQNIPNHLLVETIADALRDATDNSLSGAKHVASRIGRSVSTVRKWFYRANAPGAAELIELMREFDEVYDAVMQLAGRAPDQTTAEQKARIEQALAILQGRDAA